jgi:hypothetical protein
LIGGETDQNFGVPSLSINTMNSPPVLCTHHGARLYPCGTEKVAKPQNPVKGKNQSLTKANPGPGAGSKKSGH